SNALVCCHQWTIALCGFEQFDSLEVIRQHLWQLLRRRAAEAAIGAQPEIRREPANDRQPFAEAVHAVDHPEVEAGVAAFETGERGIERVVRAVEGGNMNPVDASP